MSSASPPSPPTSPPTSPSFSSLPPPPKSDKFCEISLDTVEQTKPKSAPTTSASNSKFQVIKTQDLSGNNEIGVGVVGEVGPSFLNLKLAQHMTIAGGFLDFALFVADVEHLKFILDTGKDNVRYYTLLFTLLVVSLLLQLVVVILLMVVGFRKPTTPVQNTRFTATNPAIGDGSQSTGSATTTTTTTYKEGVILNNIIIALVTLVAIVNVFVTVFGDRSETVLLQRYKADMAFYNRTVDPYH